MLRGEQYIGGPGAGYTAPNVLKFHWWRFNAQGYFFGMLTGMAAAVIVPRIEFFKGIASLYSFPPIFAFSLFASIAASLLTAPVGHAHRVTVTPPDGAGGCV